MRKRNRILEKYQTGTRTDQAFHCGAYRRHFEDYEEQYRLDKTGKIKIERIYKGVYFQRNMNHIQDLMLKIVHFSLFCVSAVMFCLMAALPSGSNQIWYVLIPEMLSLLTLIWMLRVMILYLTAGRNLTVGEYKGCCVQLRKTAFFGTGMFTLTALALLCDLAANGTGADMKIRLWMLGMCIICICCQLSIALSEAGVKYVQLQEGV